MTELDNSVFQNIFNFGMGLVATIFGYLWKRSDIRSDRIERHMTTVENMAQNARLENKDTLLAIAGLRTHMSENYSSKSETQTSLARVHEKIEKLNDDVVRHIENLRSDIREDIHHALENHKNKA